MEMHQVRYFQATVSELNFTKAAKRCNVTQPSPTCAIKQLEDELGSDLFRRERPQVQLTELGQRMHPLLKQCYESALQGIGTHRLVGGSPRHRFVATASPSNQQHRQRVGLTSAPLGPGYPIAHSAMHPYRDSAERHLRQLPIGLQGACGGRSQSHSGNFPDRLYQNSMHVAGSSD
jgi:Bacterial regulatory helix-turn-helix protein, lysR family